MSRRQQAVDHMWELTKVATGIGSQSPTYDQQNVQRRLSDVEVLISSPAVFPVLAELVLAAYDAGRHSTGENK
jgi:hypothetical protein